MKNIGSKLNFIFQFVVVLILLFGNDSYFIEQDQEIIIDIVDTAWMIVSCAFVLLMTPGLALFYFGMVNIKNIISTMLQSFVALGVISVVWVLVGFSLVFETMTDAGIKDASAYYESLHETPLIANTIARKKLFEMNNIISDTAEYRMLSI